MLVEHGVAEDVAENRISEPATMRSNRPPGITSAAARTLDPMRPQELELLRRSP
jgi:hypothetical protein